jgi:hypothetical protein
MEPVPEPCADSAEHTAAEPAGTVTGAASEPGAALSDDCFALSYVLKPAQDRQPPPPGSALLQEPCDVAVVPRRHTTLPAAAPRGACAAPLPPVLYVSSAHAIHRVADGAVTLVAGAVNDPGFADGCGTAARFNWPSGLCLSPDGETLLISDSNNHRLRLLELGTDVVTTLAGDGSIFSDGGPIDVSLCQPADAVFAPNGGHVYLTCAGVDDYDQAIVAPGARNFDGLGHTVRSVDLRTAAVHTVAGLAGVPGFADGCGERARFNFPSAIVSADTFSIFARCCFLLMARC